MEVRSSALLLPKNTEQGKCNLIKVFDFNNSGYEYEKFLPRFSGRSINRP